MGTFQIQHATEQEVDDFYQVQPTTANEEEVEEEPTTTKVEKDVTSEVKLESKTPPPSPAIEQGSYDMEGGPRILEDFGTLNEGDDELVLVLENQDSIAVFEKQGADTSLVE